MIEPRGCFLTLLYANEQKIFKLNWGRNPGGGLIYIRDPGEGTPS